MMNNAGVGEGKNVQWRKLSIVAEGGSQGSISWKPDMIFSIVVRTRNEDTTLIQM